MPTSISKKKFFLPTTIICIICCGLVFLLQNYFASLQDQRPPFVEISYLPKGNFLKKMALTYDEALADLFWIQTIGYFGNNDVGDNDYQKLESLIDIVTTLDPRFEDPYEFGGIVFAEQPESADRSIRILKKGIEEVPQHHKRYWYLPFFAAFDYMYHKHDYLSAARYLEKAASFEGRPPYLPLLVARLYANTGDPGIAIPFLEEMLKSATTEEQRDKLQKRINDIQIKQHINILQRAVAQFYQQSGRQIQKLDELVEEGILQSLPVEPYGGHYTIDENQTVRSTTTSDDLQLYLEEKKNNSDTPLIFVEEKK